MAIARSHRTDRRTVADAALLLGVIAGTTGAIPAACRSSGDRSARERGALDGLRIGFSARFRLCRRARDVRTAFKQAVDALADLGAEMVADEPGRRSRTCWNMCCKPIAFTEQAAAVSGRDPSQLARSEQEYRECSRKGGPTVAWTICVPRIVA